jgi:hypothetical protein
MGEKLHKAFLPIIVWLIGLAIPGCSGCPSAAHSPTPPLDDAPIQVLDLNPNMSE